MNHYDGAGTRRSGQDSGAHSDSEDSYSDARTLTVMRRTPGPLLIDNVEDPVEISRARVHLATLTVEKPLLIPSALIQESI